MICLETADLDTAGSLAHFYFAFGVETVSYFLACEEFENFVAFVEEYVVVVLLIEDLVDVLENSFYANDFVVVADG